MIKKNTRNSKSIFKDRIWLYGLHSVLSALKNPRRKIHQIILTKNSYKILQKKIPNLSYPITIKETKFLNQIFGAEVVHQGFFLETERLSVKNLNNLHEKRHRFIVILNNITDPHNVGAIIRSSVAFNASAIITTINYSSKESGALAKAASGALEMIDFIMVNNLHKAIEKLKMEKFQIIGLDPKSTVPFESIITSKKIAIVLGSEGKGLQKKITKEILLGKLNINKKIQSLNVSNAAAIAFYITNSYLNGEFSLLK